jgi:hypothetical protein
VRVSAISAPQLGRDKPPAGGLYLPSGKYGGIIPDFEGKVKGKVGSSIVLRDAYVVCAQTRAGGNFWFFCDKNDNITVGANGYAG